MWWHVWTTHPAGVAPCGCEDPSLTTWFLEWPAYALTHGHNPLYSTALFHPGGINLVSNTGMLTVGVPLVPVTLLFGPTASLNVALTVGPALSGLAGYVLARRFVTWWPAAFLSGVLVAFSPYAISNLAVAHLDLALLGFVPLTVLCLDEICRRQRHRPVVAGLELGVVLVLQFFLSSEVLATTVVFVAVGLLVLLVAGLLFARDELAARLPGAATGLAVAAAVAAALLAYPVFFALAGPAHFSGRVWPTIPVGSGGASLASMFLHLGHSSLGAERYFAGYLGSALASPSYLGPGLVAASLVVAVAMRRDRRIFFFLLIEALTVVAAVGDRSYWTPWRLVAGLPLFDDVFPGRIVGLSSVAFALVLAIGLEGVWRRSGEWAAARGSRSGSRARGTAALVSLVVAGVAFAPLVAAVIPELPLAVSSLSIPPAFSSGNRIHLAGQVVLTFPPPAAGGDAMTWQAMDALSFSLVTGGGPGALLRRAGPERAGEGIVVAAGSLFASYAAATAVNLASLRRALRLWGVTLIVVPRPGEVVPHYDRAPAVRWALAFFTAALGRGPRLEEGSFLWRVPRHEKPPIVPSRGGLQLCETHTVSLAAVPLCVLDSR